MGGNQFSKECKDCHQTIVMQNQGGVWKALNKDFTPHVCANGSKAQPIPASSIIGRITEYEGNNVHIGSKILFVPTERRSSWKEKYPVGTAVSAMVDKGTCKDIDTLTGPNLERFLKAEEAKRNQQVLPETKPAAAQQPASANPEKPTETCTSPKDTPAEALPITKEEDIWKSEFEEFKAILSSTKRDGIPELLTYLEKETDFFIAPSSTKYHDAVPGGLLHHSLKVYHNLVAFSKTFKGEWPEESLKIIALLHDTCKINHYKLTKKSLPRKDDKGNLILDDWGKKIWDETESYEVEDQLPLGHGEKSAIILQRFIKLSDLEIMGIRWHMMSYDDVAHSYAGNLAITNASDKYRIIPLVHMADLSASFLEMGPTGGVS